MNSDCLTQATEVQIWSDKLAQVCQFWDQRTLPSIKIGNLTPKKKKKPRILQSLNANLEI